MGVIDFLGLGSDFLSAEVSFLWEKDVICITNILNVDQTGSEYIAAYDPLERLDGRLTNDALDFLYNLAHK